MSLAGTHSQRLWLWYTEKAYSVVFEAEQCLRNLHQRSDFDTNDRWTRVCTLALPCVCVIYNIIATRDWLIVTIYLNSARISLASVDNWENFPRGFEIYGDFIYFRFQTLRPISTGLSQVHYNNPVLFCQSKHSRCRGLSENEILSTNRIIFYPLSATV